MTYTIQQVFKSVERLGGSGAVAINEPADAITEAGISKETKERLGGIEPAALISSLQSNAKWDLIRETRDMKLAACDWTQIGDSSLSTSKQNEWKTYRQSLRDVTTQADPDNITWASEPEAG